MNESGNISGRAEAGHPAHPPGAQGSSDESFGEVSLPPGGEGVTRIVEDGALHLSRGQATRRHAHVAWKIHVGLDAPVWLETTEGGAARSDGARVIVAPPNATHRTGAVGWSAAVFVSAGSRGTSWGVGSKPEVLTGRRAQRILDACRGFDLEARASTPDFIEEIARLLLDPAERKLDPRVEAALDALERHPNRDFSTIAKGLGLSLDRLSRLVVKETGLTLRRHRLWLRLVGAFSLLSGAESLTEVAVKAGFSDHAHMTRAYGRFLGRVPYDFKAPPDVLCPW